MTVTINASTSTGLVQTADTSGIIKLQSNGVTTNALAWVNFNGSTAAIRSQYNVASITKNGTGDYTVNFSTSLSDANYSALGTNSGQPATGEFSTGILSMSTSSVRMEAFKSGVGTTDPTYFCVAIFGN
jgi:hypothetical protein